MCNECENFYCGDCIDHHLLNNKSCPTCRKQFEEKKISRHLKLLLNQIVIKCPLKCEVNINYENLESHLFICNNAKKIYKCKLCRTEIITKNFEDKNEILKHNKKCLNIPVICKYCKKEFKKGIRLTHILRY